MKIYGEAVISCYFNAIALVLMLVLSLFAEQIRKTRRALIRDFFSLSICVIVNGLLSLLYNAMYRHTAPWCHTVALLARTLREGVTLYTVRCWIWYVYHRLFGEEKMEHVGFQRSYSVLFYVCLALLAVNLPTGIAFTLSAENRIEPGLPLLLMNLAEYLCFCSASVIIRARNRVTSKTQFFHVTPIILLITLTAGTQYYTPYDLTVLGQAGCCMMLYFSMIGEYRYVDERSGLYNKGYLAQLFDTAVTGKSDFHSAVILEADGDIRAAMSILRDTLHRHSDVIRIGERKCLMFSRESSVSTLQYQTSLMDEAMNRHNQEHPESVVRITARSMFRKEGEDAVSFLHSVLKAREETGNEIKGIVSMISELDRLDQELKLAADIQLNILPQNFPPFPDRKEFDLFASMIPAKEVGGDFYDFFLIDSDHLGLVIADVSGKGIPAALFMMVSKTMVKNQLMSGCDPAAALERVNVQLYERNPSMMFVTVWAAVLEISTGRGNACNAGHEKPGIRRAGGDFELLEYPHCPLMGLYPKVSYSNRAFRLGPGDTVFVYTDGVPEASDAAMNMFGEERLKKTLNQFPDACPEELIQRVGSEVDRFVGGAPRFDDTTMLCLRYHGAPDWKAEETEAE